jgi:hypothetical protein
VLVSVLGLVGSSATQPLIDNLGKVAPGPAQDIFTSAIKNLQGSKGAAGVFFVIGLLGALLSASGYVAAFMRASNRIYDIEEGRPVWKTLRRVQCRAPARPGDRGGSPRTRRAVRGATRHPQGERRRLRRLALQRKR